METCRDQFLRVALVAFGIAFLLALPAAARVALRLDVAAEPARVRADDRGNLRDARRLPPVGLARAPRTPEPHGHLPGDVAALFFVALVLGWLTPRGVVPHARPAGA